MREPRKPLIGAIVAVVGLLMFVSGCGGDADSRPHGDLADIQALAERNDLNVLFILVDTLRAERLGAYGYERDTSPVIDELARTGMRFDRHISQSSWTKCSMASLWTGLYPNRTGVLYAQHAIPESAVLPAEIFRDAGYRTAGIWRNGWIAPNFGFNQGFEIYHSPGAFMPQSVQAANPEKIAAGDGDLIRSATVFLRTHAHEPWLLYLHMMDVHQYSYDEASAIFGSSYSDSYDNSILWTDTLIGHLIAELDRLGLRDKTLVVLAADHGEAFGEHGGEGHARNVYGEVTETPVIVSFPFKLSSSLVVKARTQNVDLWPTILDLVGLTELEDTDGRSMVEEIEAAARHSDPIAEDAPAIAHLQAAWSEDPGDVDAASKALVALNSDRWRLHYDARFPDSPQLYDKQEDPAELRNLAGQEPEVVEDLMAMIEEYLEQTDAPWGEEASVIEIDEMQLRQLRAIGYGVP